MTEAKSDQERKNQQRKARLADQLRANLQKRKAQTRSRRTGEADSRPEGIVAGDDKKDPNG